MFRTNHSRSSLGRSSSEAVLQKASAQLRGERVKTSSSSFQNPEDDDDIGAYLSSLSRKTTQQSKNVPAGTSLADLSEMSLSTTDDSTVQQKLAVPTSNSRFLKKKTPQAQQSTISSSKPTKVQQKPKTALSSDFEESRASKSAYSSGGTKRPQSSALNKATAFANKYENKPNYSQAFHISDSDMDISVDDEVLSNIKHRDVGKGHHGNVNAPSRFGDKSAIKTRALSPSDDDSIGKGGSRFLKKSATTGVSPSEVGWGGKPLGVPDLEISQDSDRGRPRDRNRMTVSFDVSDDSVSSEGGNKKRGRGSALRLNLTGGSHSVKASTSVSFDTDDEIHYIDVGSPSSSRDLEPDGILHKPPPSPTSTSVPRGKGVLKKPRRSPSPEKRSPSPPQIRRTPTPPLATRSVSTSQDEEDEDSSDDSFKLNVMELDSLEPLLVLEKEASSSRKSSARKPDTQPSSAPKTSAPTKPSKSQAKGHASKTKSKEKDKKEKSPTENDLFSGMGLFTVEDLIGRAPSPDISEASEVQEVASVMSEIKTDTDSAQQYESDFESEYSRSRSPSPKLKTKHLGSSSRSQEVISEVEAVSSARSVATYSEEPETLHTEKTETISEASTSDKVYKRHDSYSESDSDTLSRSRSPSPSYTDSSTYTDSYSYTYESYTRSDSRSVTKQVKKTKCTSAGVQTSDDTGLWYHWNVSGVGQAVADKQFGLNMVDPSPIATHIINVDTLEAVTAYSPVILALHDMLKQQLQLTQQFVQSQRHLHQSFVEALEPDHHYTTLEDTKHYIRKHRKPTLTFDEALQKVKEEMGIE